MKDDDYVRLQYVHPVLAATVCLCYARYTALGMGPFRVTSGFRTDAEQAKLQAAGKSRTSESLHERGLAVDLAILSKDRSVAYWEMGKYEALNAFMQKAFQPFRAIHPDGALVWGGNWRTFRDGVHWELSGIQETMPHFSF